MTSSNASAHSPATDATGVPTPAPSKDGPSTRRHRVSFSTHDADPKKYQPQSADQHYACPVVEDTDDPLHETSGGKPTDPTSPANFAMNGFTLMFKDTETEAGYVRFITSQAYFAAGKLYAVIGSFILVALVLPFLSWHPTWDGLSNGYILCMLGAAVAGFVCFGLMFLSTAPRWREVLFTFVLATHWISFGTTAIRAKEDGLNRYAVTTACLFYCFFLAQPRFILMFVFLMIMASAAMATVTFGSDTYYQTHNHFEVLYWPILIAAFPVQILRKFELRSRAAFEASEMTRAFLDGLAQRSKAMHRIIARSYPVAAATRLLQSHGSSQYAQFADTALIVTDVQGFTAWAAVTSNERVVEGIAVMFMALERAALKFAVEKIATVGDCFVGAVFPAAPAVDDGDDKAVRCHRILRFAHAVVRDPKTMTVRVGVHVGDVMGGFVGLQPPKFDVFGEAVKVTQALETTGRPNCIHASIDVVGAASKLGFPSEDCEATPHGSLFTAWRLHSPRSYAEEVAQMVQDTQAVEKDAMLLCALVARSSEALYDRTMRQGDTRDAATRKRLQALATIVSNDDGFALQRRGLLVQMEAEEAHAEGASVADSAAAAEVSNEEDVSRLYVFSIFTLAFADDEAELEYRRWYLATELPTVIFTTLTWMMLYLLGAHVCTACTHTARNKLSVILATAVLIGYLHLLREQGTSHGHNPKIAIAVNVCVLFVIGLMYEPGCADLVNANDPSNSVMLLGLIGPVSAMLCLELHIFVRTLIHTALCAQLVLLVVVRHLVYGPDEGVLEYDVFPAAVFAALALMSYFTDFNLRLAFQNESRQSALEALERRSADLCNAGLEMLLPTFVVERLVKATHSDEVDVAELMNSSAAEELATEDGGDNRSLVAGSEVSSLRTNDVGGGGDSRRRAASSIAGGQRSTSTLPRPTATSANAFWTFPRAVVVFVSFEPPGAAFDYDTVRDTVARIEVAARARGLQKVKTIGTTVLLVAGADENDSDGLTTDQQHRQHAEVAINAAEAAIEIRRSSFVNTGLAGAGWSLQVGIHAGPIFGAVIGSQGVAFDIYGDTVNTASRMCTTAATADATAAATTSTRDAIQCSEAFYSGIPHDATAAGLVGFAMSRRASAVEVKGKGLMTVYNIDERTAAATAVSAASCSPPSARRVTMTHVAIPAGESDTSSSLAFDPHTRQSTLNLTPRAFESRSPSDNDNDNNDHALPGTLHH